jgi:hypothetical protein
MTMTAAAAAAYSISRRLQAVARRATGNYPRITIAIALSAYIMIKSWPDLKMRLVSRLLLLMLT